MHARRLLIAWSALAFALGCGGADPAPEATPAHADHHARGGHGHHHGGHGHQGGMPHRFEDAERWAERFEDPARDAWQQPAQVIGWLVDRPDLVVLDIGSATGYFPVRFAQAVPQGHVFGVDVERSMVDYLTRRAANEGLTNLTSRLAATDDPGIDELPRKPDLVFVCNTYHHISDRVAYFRSVLSALPEGARLAIVDFRPESELGPPRRHKIPAEVVTAELTEAGWRLAAHHQELREQYVLVFER